MFRDFASAKRYIVDTGVDMVDLKFTDLAGRPQYLVGEHRPAAELLA